MGLFDKIKAKKENKIFEREKDARLIEIKEKTGADFTGYISQEELKNHEVNGCSYEASYDMPEIIENLRVTPQDALIDVGCGKGYAMHYFSRLAFGRIDGIEYNEQRVLDAKENIRKLHHGDKRFNVICADACKFTEYDKYNYIYMYNPLNLQGMKQVSENLKESLKRKPRNMYIIYQNPRFWEVFTEDGIFERVVMADKSLIMRHKE